MLRKSARNLGSQIVSFAVTFGDRIILIGLLIRSWGAETFSDWVTLVAAAGLFSLAELGFQIQYGNRLSQAHARGDATAYARALSVGLFVYGALVAAFLIVLGAIFFTIDITRAFRLSRLSHGAAALVFGTLGVAGILRVARAALSQIYRSRGEFHRGILVDSGVMGLTVCAAALAAFCSAGPVVVALVYLGAEVAFGWGGMGLDITRRYPDLRLWPEVPRRAEWTEIRRTLGWYALLSGLPTAWLHVPVLVLGMLSLGGVGLVSFVVQRSLVNFSRTLSNMLSVAAGIELATLVHKEAYAELNFGVTILARLNAVLAGALAAGLLCFGPAVVAIWTGNA
jgi:hypothetical protein